MKIVFLGDSITKGIPKVSYFEMLRKKLNENDLVNLGKGGDTVKSLHRRIRKKPLETHDAFVLFIGVNDVYSRVNRIHKVLKTVRGQFWSKDFESFKREYTDLIEFLNNFQKEYVVIAPLLFGEDLNNKWNKELDEYEKIIRSIIENYEHITYLDIRNQFQTYLKDKEVSTYLPISLFETGKDVATLTSNELVDEVSTSRGLYLTLDGCHLNSSGANIVAEGIVKHFKK